MKRKYLIILPIIILFIISIIYLPNSLKIKQLIWIILGLLFMVIISKIKFNKILKYSLIYYIVCIILLILVLVLNKFTNGSRAWLNIGFISIQPSELVKLSLILISIKYFDKLNVYTLLIIYIIPIILIFLEPDTGGIIQELIILSYFIFKKLNNKQIIKLLIIIGLLLLIGVFTFLFNKELLIKLLGPSIFYRIDRITTFLSDDSIQTTNALISIATGNILYFPEMFNDFFISYILSKNIYLIIPIIISTISLLIMLKRKKDIIFQISFYLIFWQCYYNLAMNLKLVPVIGIPYLFLSYGGSHIITSLLLIGLALSSMDNNYYNMVLDNN